MLVLQCTDKLFSLLPLTKVTVEGDSQTQREREREKKTQKPVWGRRSFPKEGAKIKSPYVWFCIH